MRNLDRFQKKMIGARIADRYLVTGTIGSGGMGLVLAAIPFEDPSREVAIKVIRSKRMGPDVLMRFQKEAALMSRLHHPCIISFLELGLMDAESAGFVQSGSEPDEREKPSGSPGSEETGSSAPGGYYIVMERASGRNLKDLIGRNGRQSLRFFFQLGTQVAQALDYTHRKNIIHRDIKPQNIIVDRPFGDSREVNVKVLDFGVASLSEAVLYTGRDQNPMRRPGDMGDEIAGTPLYMAPELTRMIDAPVDHRVDLYALGAVLYEALSGHTPFSADTREKLEKLHAFASPEPLSSRCPDVPPYVEAIVHKLLSKHPDQRYQSAFGLQADLARAKALYDIGSVSLEALPLGRYDKIEILSRPMKFSGRNSEMAALQSNYEAVASAQGRSRMTVLRGPAGAGKSRVISEFRDGLVKREIRFVSGRFSSHESALPFNALANAFNEYLMRLSRSKSAEASEFHEKVKTLLGPLAHQIAQVVPGLLPFVADIPEPEVMFGADEEGFKAFAKIFSDFTRCLASDTTPFIFIFDDLQWADDKSVRLIDQFFSNANSQRFLLIVSVRSASVAPGSEVEGFLSRFSRLKRRFQEIEINSMTRGALAPLVEETLGRSFLGDEKIETRFIDWLYSRTGGNLLHVSELLRVLVANDHLRMRRDGSWTIDLDRLLMDPPKVDSVDLVLGRLADFKESDRRALEGAAVAGMTFQFEVLRGGSGDEGESGMDLVHALQRAVGEGIVVRGSGDDDLKALGKTYSFVHSRAREDIYASIPLARRCVLHLAIARRLEALVPSPSGKTVFSLAQHFNRALDGGVELAQGRVDSRQLLLKAIKYNLQAGNAALDSNSWQTAETYFKSVERLMHQAGPGGYEISEQLRVLEVLADLAAAQRRTSDALQRYRGLIAMTMPDGKRIALAVKVIRFYVSLGVMGESMKLVEDSLARLGSAFKQDTLWNRLSARFWLWFDGTFSDRRWSRSWRLLRKSFNKKTVTVSSAQAVNLFQNASHALMYRNKVGAFLAHDKAFAVALQAAPSQSVALRLVAERAALLACKGFFQSSFRAFDLVMDISKASGARSEFAYVSLLRVISADYLRARHDEMSDHLRMVVANLKPDQDRLAHGIAVSFQIHRELQRLNLDRVKSLSMELPEYRALRSPVSSRSVMISTFAFLLRDSRDEIVNFAESYLKHRRRDGGRMDDLFTLSILAMVAFARGELDKARKSYARVIQGIPMQRANEFLWPFEEDSLALFLVVFPVLYQRESGVEILPAPQMKQALRGLLAFVNGMQDGERTVPLLLRARISELLGTKEVSRALYDRSLRQAKLAGDNLSQVLGYLWFGMHLSERGLKPRLDYLRRASVLAAKGGVKALSEVIARSGGVSALAEPSLGGAVNDGQSMVSGEKAQFLAGDSVAIAAATRNNGMGPWATGKLHPMEYAMLRLVSANETRRLDLAADLRECLAFVAKTFQGSRVFCFRRGPSGQGLQNAASDIYGHDTVLIGQHLIPYVQIKSTLFLPLHDAPWIHKVSHVPGMGDTSASSSAEDDILTLAPVRLDLTNAKSGSVEASESSSGSKGSGLGAVVPLRWGGENIGLMFIEDSGALAQEDSTAVRQALDNVGAQISSVMERRSRCVNYRTGAFLVESQPWLRIWDFGNFRSQRETGWYLGLNFGEDRHVMFYLSCAGPEHVRAKFSAHLWHHLFAVRTIMMADASREIDSNDIRTELAKFLLTDRTFKALEQISLSFSIVSRTKNTAISGHFGVARPVVVNGNNRVSPGNESLMSLSGGRELRYWDVESTMGEQQVLVVSYDTSKLDGVTVSSPHSVSARSGSQPFDELSVADRPSELHQILASRLPVDVLPRYYVAIMRQRIARSGSPEANAESPKMVG
jgi:serine/threonine protein kinase